MAERGLLDELRDLVLTDEEQSILEEAQDDSIFPWPPDEYVVPPDPQHDGDTTQTVFSPPFPDGKFYMPPDEHDFSCNQCDGRLGPWVHKGVQINVDGCYQNSLYVNLLHKRERYCTECDHTHFNCYPIGRVYFNRKPSGTLTFDHFQ